MRPFPKCIPTTAAAWLLIATLTATHHHAHAADLPPIINTSTYTSVDDTVTSTAGGDGGGTTLYVPAMLADATSKGLTEAVFDATRTTFNNGTITISLPTTAAAWTTYNIPLRVTIRDGISGTVYPTSYIRITGVLALGSSIIVQGGAYEFTDNFIELPSDIAILDGSTLAIKGGAFRLRYPVKDGAKYMYTRLVHGNGSITINAASTLSIDNNTMVGNDVNGSDWNWQTVYAYAEVSISDNSNLSITNNKMVASNLAFSLSWYVCDMYASDNCTIDSSSAIVVSHNDMVVSNSTMESFYRCAMYLNSFDRVSISGRSMLAINHNNFTVLNVSAKGDIGAYNLFGSDDVSLTDSSACSVSNNTMSIMNVTAAGSLNLFMVYSGPVVMTGVSRLRVDGNKMEVRDVHAGGSCILYDLHLKTLVLGTTACLLDNSSSISVSHSETVVSKVTAFFCTRHFLWFMNSYSADIPVSANSTISVTHNKVLAFELDVTMWALYTLGSTSLTLTNGSDVSVSNNIYIISNSTENFYFYLANTGPTRLDGNSTFTVSNNTNTLSNLSGYSLMTRDLLASYFSATRSSSYLITNNKMVASNISFAEILTYGLHASFEVRLDDSSTVTNSHNDIVASNVTALHDWGYHAVSLSASYAEATYLKYIANGSTFIIYNNNIWASNVTAKRVTWDIVESNTPLHIYNSSTLSAFNNTMTMMHANITTTLSTNFGVSRVLNLTGKSTYSVSNNTMSLHSVSVWGSWQVSAVIATGSVSLVDWSTLSVSNNRVVVWSAMVMGTWNVSTLTIGTATNVSDSSAIMITNNNVSLSHVLATSDCQWITANITATPLMLTGQSNLSVTGNSAAASNITILKSLTWAVLDVSGIISTMENGAVTVTSNVMDAYMVAVQAMYQWSAVVVTNTIPPNTTTSNNHISMCDVYAGGTVCNATSCGAVSFDQEVVSVCDPPTTTTTTTTSTTTTTTDTTSATSPSTTTTASSSSATASSSTPATQTSTAAASSTSAVTSATTTTTCLPRHHQPLHPPPPSRQQHPPHHHLPQQLPPLLFWCWR